MEKSARLEKVDEDYLKLLEIALIKIFPDMPNQKDLALAMEIGKNTYFTLFSGGEASKGTLSKVSAFCGIIEYDIYKKRRVLIEKLENQLLSGNGQWISYRLSSNRRMHRSIWKFESTVDKKSVLDSKKEGKNYKPREYIRVTKIIQHEDRQEELTGALEVKPDLTAQIDLNSENNIHLSYYSVFFDSVLSDDFINKMSYLLFEGTLLIDEKQYTQLEVLIKQQHEAKIDPRLIREEVPFMPDKNGSPTNDEYLAFNFLTRNSGKTRRFIDNHGINQPKPNGGKLGYKHNIFISCPIAYLIDDENLKNDEEFDRLRSCVDAVTKSLNETYKFQDIYCEISNYNSINNIPLLSRPDAFDAARHINSTHYMAIIPETLGVLNSGVYMEIYYRIQNKLPALIYVENNEARLPSLLTGLLKARKDLINIALMPVSSLKMIGRALEGSKDNKVFPFNFDLRIPS